MQEYTTANLLTSVKRKAMIPSSQGTFTDVDILEIATEEIQVGMVPMLLKVREEYYVTFEDQSIVQDQDAYPIPKRAIAGALRDILYSPADPVGTRSEIVSVPRVEPDEIPWRQNTSAAFSDYYFALRDNNILLVPTPRSSRGTLRLLYHRRPSNLIETSAAAQVTALTSSDTVTVNAVPDTISATTTVDLIKGEPGFDFHQVDRAIAAVDNVANTIQFSSDYDTDLAVGDWIAISGDSPIPQVPLELQSVLAQRVVVQILESLGDQNGKASAENKLRQIEESVMNLITPRMRGEPRKVSLPTNQRGYLRGN